MDWVVNIHVKLNSFGNRAKGISPGKLESYKCFKECIYCPLTGKVIEIVDGHPDNPIGEWDIENPAGNFVAIINHDSIIVILCHMMKSSVSVKKGETVSTNQLIGKIGNSGHSSEPHLHISAFYKDNPVPIQFNDSYLSLNGIIKQ